MNFLYVDNFRGFQKTTIPIKRVNFLVGENSTGKSTILDAINILQSIDFWLNQEFNLPEKHLGSFENIVSKNSDISESFRIGWSQINKNNNNKDKFTYAICMEFKKRKGQPYVRRIIYKDRQGESRFKITENEIRYKIIETDPDKSVFRPDRIEAFFESWSKHKSTFRKNYNRQRITERSPTGALTLLSSLIERRLPLRSGFAPRGVGRFAPHYHLRFAWLAPIRSQPERIYDIGRQSFSPEGTHTPHLLREILNDPERRSNFERYLRKFGAESGLFEAIDIDSYGDSDSYTTPFSLSVALDKSEMGINDVGYGVSQVLPVIVEMFDRQNATWFSIQQPEVHLHPRARAALGDIFFDLAKIDKKTFLVETHSDYIIDRYRYNVKSNEDKLPYGSQILFFERGSGFNNCHLMDINEDGTIPDNPPDSYREFFVVENMKTLKI